MPNNCVNEPQETLINRVINLNDQIQFAAGLVDRIEARLYGACPTEATNAKGSGPEPVVEYWIGIYEDKLRRLCNTLDNVASRLGA